MGRKEKGAARRAALLGMLFALSAVLSLFEGALAPRQRGQSPSGMSMTENSTPADQSIRGGAAILKLSLRPAPQPRR